MNTRLLLLLGGLLIACEEKDRVEGTEPGDCTDSADNDGDGLFDCEDEGCIGSEDCLGDTDVPDTGENNTVTDTGEEDTATPDTLDIDNKNYQSIEFIKEMDDFYKRIDILVGRAGGGSLEAAYLGIPQILIPYKHGTTSSHQELNAKYLEDKGWGITVNTFDELTSKIKNISKDITENKLNLPNIPIGNQSISKELYEQIN